MAGSQQYSVTSGAAVLIAAAPASAGIGPCGWFYIATTQTIYIGGSSAVSSSNGATATSSGPFTGWLFPGDQIWAVASSTTSSVSVLQTGA
jgi:hypothetical protein